MTKRMIKIAAAAALICASASHALIGVGFQWGFDVSLNMEDSKKEQIELQNTTLDVGEMLNSTLSSTAESDETMKAALESLDSLLATIPNSPVGNVNELINEITGNSNLEAKLPFYLSRSDWTRSMVNIGGKVWVDLKRLKLINALEASFNFGVWEYKGSINYPGSVKSDIGQSDVESFLETGDYNKLFNMEQADITLESVGLDYLKMFGVSQTPVMKFHLDLTVKKNLVAKPEASKRFKLYLGVGPSLHLATPILTPEFINDIVNESLEGAANTISAGEVLFDGEGLQKKILDKLIEEAKNPTFGANIVLGTSLKLPVIPVAFFADMKYMLYFGDLDDNVDIKAPGYRSFLFNLGAAVSF